MSDNSTRYREIDVSGVPRELGRQIGEAAREEIRGFAEVALQRVNKTVTLSREQALAIARDCVDYAKSYRPDLLDELLGMSEASAVALDELMLLQVRNQFIPAALDAACTSFSVMANSNRAGRNLVGQNWDNDPALDEFTIVLTRRPTGKPALMNVTQAGLIAYIGFSDAGMGVCLNTLPAPSRAVGVPHYFTVRAIYESVSLDEAANAVRSADRAISANIMLATPEGPADLEVTLDDVRVLRANDGGVLTHTNHCLHPELLSINEEFPELIQSGPRLRRIDEQLKSLGDAVTVERLQSALRDHEGHPRSICRHTNDDPETGFWQTVFAVVIDPAERQMHVSRGTPCDHAFEVYQLS